MKLLDRGILHRGHERLPELPDDVTIPDDLSGLELREAADRRRPATAIRWLRWLPVFLLVAVGAIVLTVESTGDDTQTIVPSAVPWEEGRGPDSNSLNIPATAASVSSWPAGDGPWTNSVTATAVTPSVSSWPAGDGPWTNSVNASALTASAVPLDPVGAEFRAMEPTWQPDLVLLERIVDPVGAEFRATEPFGVLEPTWQPDLVLLERIVDPVGAEFRATEPTWQPNLDLLEQILNPQYADPVAGPR